MSMMKTLGLIFFIPRSATGPAATVPTRARAARSWPNRVETRMVKRIALRDQLARTLHNMTAIASEKTRRKLQWTREKAGGAQKKSTSVTGSSPFKISQPSLPRRSTQERHVASQRHSSNIPHAGTQLSRSTMSDPADCSLVGNRRVCIPYSHLRYATRRSSLLRSKLWSGIPGAL
jgi:hypothetical protein